MKTASSLAFFAALTVLVACARLEISIAVLFTAGFAAIVAHDYIRHPRAVPAVMRPRRKLAARFHPPALTVALQPHRLTA